MGKKWYGGTYTESNYGVAFEQMEITNGDSGKQLLATPGLEQQSPLICLP